MDNTVVSSSSDILTDGSNSDESIPDEDTVIDEKSETNPETVVTVVSETVSEIELSNDSKNRDLVLDLRNLNEISCNFNNDEDKYEKLSEVIEEPGDLPAEVAILDHGHIESCSNDLSDKSRAIQERIHLLNIVVSSLREELKAEVSLWRKERDEFHMLQEKSDLLALEEATTAARAAAEAYAAESPLSENLDGMQYNCFVNFPGEILDVNPEQTLSELTILEYEKKLAKYQDALALAQAEKRYNMRRQIAANTYRQKLIEVERLCDEELEKIKQNASSLQPLKQMVSQWYASDRCGGDAAVDKSASPSSVDNCVYKSPPYSFQRDYQWSTFSSVNTKSIGNKIDAEVNMAPEIFVAKFKSDASDFHLQSGNMLNGTDWIENVYDRRHNMDGGSHPALSLKWESSNYTLSTALGNP